MKKKGQKRKSKRERIRRNVAFSSDVRVFVFTSFCTLIVGARDRERERERERDRERERERERV